MRKRWKADIFKLPSNPSRISEVPVRILGITAIEKTANIEQENTYRYGFYSENGK